MYHAIFSIVLASVQTQSNSQELPMKLFTRRRKSGPASDGYSVIDAQLVITGDLASDGTIRVDGKVEGALHTVDTLIIGAGACVVGNVQAREVVIGGELRGSLRVSGRVEVQQSGTVHGDIQAAAVMLAEGGTVDGHVVVHPLADALPLTSGRRLMLTPSRDVAAVAQG
jgi:cytoskeletal protein CcmA (bactofilin family)